MALAAVGAVATPAKADVPLIEILPPVILPVAETLLPAIVPVADTLPPAMLPVTTKLMILPTEVMLGCAGVVNVPEILVAEISPAVMLPLVDMGLELKAARFAATLALPYMPVNWLPLPKI